MKYLPASSFLAIAFFSSVVLAAQVPATPVEPNRAAPSATMQPALTSLQDALSIVRVDRWKTSGAIRDQAETNISSIHRDLEGTLPTLLTSADSAPDSVTRLLPVYSNVNALYDVLLRISSVARLSAPAQQSDALDHALTDLDAARRSFSERIQSSAAAQEQQIGDLKASLRSAPPAPAPAPIACPPVPPAPAKKRVIKPKPKAATPATQTH